MDIEKLKELMTPVAERLPEDTHTYYCLNNEVEYILCYRHKYCTKGYWNVVGSRKEINTVTHWLDPSTLTTKAKAMNLARVISGYQIDSIEEAEEFINEHKTLL